MRRAFCRVVLMTLVVAGCGDGPTGPAGECDLDLLPLESEGDGPSVTDVVLEDQAGAGIVLHVTATDPQGSDDLFGVIQRVGVFRNDRCEGQPIVLEDDLAGSGLEESFGTVVEAATDPGIHASIVASGTWPVSLEFRDATGNVLEGQVLARVVR